MANAPNFISADVNENGKRSDLTIYKNLSF